MVPAHKQLDPHKAPGQVLRPVAPIARRLRGTLGEVIDRAMRQEVDAERVAAERQRLGE